MSEYSMNLSTNDIAIFHNTYQTKIYLNKNNRLHRTTSYIWSTCFNKNIAVTKKSRI